ncbi:MAG TPA: hypothetical protein VLE49_17045 [Anaerolineales bacterium]|nr:hypothetical protein [Anaerolineales bacterium]
MDERRLRRFFRFTEADLLANRRGQFSEGQEKRLSQEAKAERASARSSATILFVIAAAGLAVGLTIGSIAPTGIGRILVFLLMGILWPSAWAGKAVQIIRSARSLQEPRLCQVSGSAHIVQHADGSYIMQVGDFEFDLDDNPSGVIVEGDEYTIHYLEATEEILSVENLIRGI